MKDQLERVKELVSILNKASKMYYQFNTSMMTDFEYDRLYDELVFLEQETGMTLSNSPTINIESEILSSLPQSAHPSQMLSLAKTKQVEQLADFLGSHTGILSWKLDGLTVVLTYENGKLLKGVTRGNGTIGEVVTENVRRFKNIPLTIPYKGHFVLRGEAVISYSDFNQINAEIETDEGQYRNPRNLCSGSVRQLDSNITAERCVNFIGFTLISTDDIISNSKLEIYRWLESQGFEVVEHVEVNSTNLAEKIEEFKARVKKYDIPSDGLVLTYDDISYSESLGTTAKHPKHSLAFKWQDETFETQLESIAWSVSRTGLINPIAVFKPIEIDGTIVSRASLHNISIMKRLKLGIGDTIKVYKANMIIPQVSENITKSDTLDIPCTCPACHQEAVIETENDINYLYCTNKLCSAKFLKRLSLFTSRNAMNIDGLSDAILSKLVSEGLIREFSDLYRLEDYREEIIKFDGFGKKSFENLINSINKSRSVRLCNFIYALGIPEIGLSRAKLICNYVNNNYEAVKKLTFEELSSISGIGEIIARAWITAFQNEGLQIEADKVVQEISFSDIDKSVAAILSGKTFVITGNVYQFNNRDELVEFIEQFGGKVVSAISSKVDYLINNDVESNSTKNRQAKQLEIEIISEEQLVQLIRSNEETKGMVL